MISEEKTILLVEDEAIIAMREELILKKYGFKVIKASDSEMAIEAVNKNPEISLILMDIELGSGPDGIETAKNILEKKNLPVVFLSSHTEPEIVNKTEEITSYGYILKDSSETVLIASIKMAFKLFDSKEKLKLQDDILVKREEFLNATLQSIGDGVLVTDEKGIITDLNHVSEKLTGWKNEDAIGKKIEDIFNIINAKTGKNASNPCKKVLESGKVVGLANHTVLISKNGERYHIADSASPIKIHDQVVGVVIVFRDVTVDYKLKEEIKESEFRFQSLFHNMKEGVALHRLVFSEEKYPINYIIVNISPQYEKILNLNKNDIIDKLATDIYGVDEAPYLREFSDVALKGKPLYFETYFPPMDKHFAISVAPWGSDGFATIFTDITERKKSEIEIKNLLKEKELLINEIHHRIKNDMNIIVSILMLQSEGSDNEEVKKSLEEAQSRVSVMFNIYNSLYQGGDFKTIELNDFLTQLIVDIKNTYSSFENISIKSNIENLQIKSRIAFSVGIIINELVNNAFKYAFHDKKGKIDISVLKKENDLLLTVTDDGKGIDKKYISGEFTTFGLKLIESLCLQHSGKFKIKNSSGTTASICLGIK